MNKKVLRTIENYNMIAKGDTVAVCLSGGADSMALFHFLCRNKENLQINLIALHVNHGLRQESLEEEKFVKDYCKKFGIEVIIYHGDMNNRTKPQGLSTEMWARQLRYQFFYQQAEKYNGKLATAHTLSDRCETVLFNVTRGSGLKGAIGIPAVRDNIIRPLINCTREEIENYCKQNNVPFVTDQTNSEDIYSRNKIRLNVIPVLKQINPEAEKLIGEFSNENAEIYTFLTQLSDNLYKNSISLKGFKLSVITSQDNVVIKFLLRRILNGYNCLSRENINAILQGIHTGSLSRQLSKDIICEIEDGYMAFYKPKSYKDVIKPQPVSVFYDKTVEFMGKSYKITRILPNEFENIRKKDKNYLNYCIDCDKINSTLLLRTRITGDKITLVKRNVTKTVKKLFVEEKLSNEKKDSLAILADSSGNVIWLEEYGVNKPYSVTEKTKNVIIIEKE